MGEAPRRRLVRSTVVGTVVALVTSLLTVLPAGAGAPTSPDLATTAAGVASLAGALDQLATDPELATPLPLTERSPAEIIGLPSLLSQSLGTSMVTFVGASADHDTVAELATFIDGLDQPGGLAFTATSAEGPGGSGTELTIGITGTFSEDVPVVFTRPEGTAEQALELRAGGDGGVVPMSFTVDIDLPLVVDLELRLPDATLDPDAVSLSPEGASFTVQGGSGGPADVSFASRYGFSEITAAGAADVTVEAAAVIADPDGSGAITRSEWEQTLVADLAPVSFTGGSTDVDLGLTSALLTDAGVTGSHGTVSFEDRDLGDGTSHVADPTPGAPAPVAPALVAGEHLSNLANVTADDALTGLSQFAAAMQAAQARADFGLPFLARRFSEAYSPASQLLGLVERQGSASVVCGKANTVPPSGEDLAGSTWYCQAYTPDEPDDGTVSWTVGNGTVSAAGTSDDTVGLTPAANVVLTDVVGEPDVSVTFSVDGAAVTATRRVRTAQELAAQLGALVGAQGMTLGYDSATESLRFGIGLSSSGSITSAFDFADGLRSQTNLAGLVSPDGAGEPVSVTASDVTLDATYGLLLDENVVGDDANASESRRYFIQVGDGNVIQVGSLSATAADFALEGTIGYLGVDVTGTSFGLTTTDGGPALGVSIALPTPLTAVPGDSPVTVASAIVLGDLLADISPIQPASVNLALATDLVVQPPVAPLDGLVAAGTYEVAVDWNQVPSADGLVVTTSEAYDERLKPFDVTPEVRGLHAGAAGDVLVDLDAKFLTAFGFDFRGLSAAERTLDVSLFNVTTGGSCPSFEITNDTTLTCAGGTSTGVNTLVGGIRGYGGENGDTPLYDNTWQPGDEYVVQGDAGALGVAILESLYDLSNQLAQSDEATFNRPVPMLGIAPKDLVPQLAPLRDLVGAINARSAAVPPEDCAVEPAPPECDVDPATLPPADLAALVTELETGLGAIETSLGGDLSSLEVSVRDDIEALGGDTHLVVQVGLGAGGTVDAPLVLDLSPGSPQALLRDPIDSESTVDAGLDVTWSSSVQLDLAVPLDPSRTLDQITVLPTTGVSLEASLGDDQVVDITASLGAQKLRLGAAASIDGVHTSATGTHTGMPLASGTAEAAPGAEATAETTVLHDADAGFSPGALADTVLVNVTKSLTCPAGTITPTSAACESGSITWTPGDAYRILSGAVLEDATRDDEGAVPFTDLIPEGSTATVTDTTGGGSCEVASATATTLTCTAVLDEGGSWAEGDAYRVDLGDPTTVLVEPGSRFDELELTGTTVRNTTDGSSCVVASATADTVTCAAALTGGTANRWAPGDAYEIAGFSIARFDLDYELSADLAQGTAATVEAYVDGLAGALDGSQDGTLNDCAAGLPDDFLGGDPALAPADGCVLLSAVLVGAGTEADPDRNVGVIAYRVDLASGATGSEGFVAPAVEALALEDDSMEFSLLSAAIGQLDRAVADLLEGTIADEAFPLIGYDHSAGAFVDEALAALETELAESLPGEFSDGMTMTQFRQGIVDGITTAVGDLADVPVGDGTESVTLAELLGTVEVTLLCRSSSTTPNAPPVVCDDTKTGSDIDDLRIAFVVGDNVMVADGATPGSISVGTDCERCGAATLPVAFDIGLPGLELGADLTLQSRVGWKLLVDVGVNRVDGPYAQVSANQFELGATVELPTKEGGCPTNPAANPPAIFSSFATDRCFSANLGLFQGTLYDGNTDSFPGGGSDTGRSRLTLDTGVDLTSIAGPDARLTLADFVAGLPAPTDDDPLVAVDAKGNVDLYFVTGIDDVPGMPQFEEGALPSMQGTIHLAFGAAVAVGEEVEGTRYAETIDYKNLYLDAGSFVNSFLIPITEQIKKFTEPFKPVIDLLRAPIPVLSDIARATGNAVVTLLSILEAVAANDLTLLRSVLDVIDFANNLRAEATNTLIGLGPVLANSLDQAPGTFSTYAKEKRRGPCGGKDATTGQRKPKDCTKSSRGGGVTTKTKVKQLEPCPATGCTGKEMTKTISRRINKPRVTGAGMSFPFLEDPNEAFGLLLGEDASLVRVDFGTLSASAGLSVSWGPFMAGPVPVEISIGGSLALGARFAMGYDTRGILNTLRQEPDEFNPTALMDGLYIDDLDKVGIDVPELTLAVTVTVGASVSVKIFKVGIFGGVTFTLAFDLQDPDLDGRLRLEEIRSFGDDPLCMFSVTGLLEFFLGLFVEIDFKIFRKRWDYELFRLRPPIELFKVECPRREPVLAQVVGSDLRLNVGSDADERYFAMEEEKERFVVRQLSAETAGVATRVSIEAFGLYQERLVPAGGRVVGSFGGDKDSVELLAGVDEAEVTFPFTLDATIDGGAGRDTVVTGAGDDIVTGGDDHDRITTNAGDDSVGAGLGNDIVTGGLGQDVLDGGDDDDNLSGDAGSDLVRGGAGNDTSTGGPGLDVAQLERVRAREALKPEGTRMSEAQLVALLDGADVLVGGAGSDTSKGHFGADTVFGGDVAGASGITTDRDLLALLTATPPGSGSFDPGAACSVTGTSTDHDELDGEDGDDRLFGGTGGDTVTGGDGADLVCGGDGNDLVDGDSGVRAEDAGTDDLRGGGGDDRLFGRAGDDTLRGDLGEDLLEGEAGNDVELGGLGSDALVGGDGNDLVLGDDGTVDAGAVAAGHAREAAGRLHPADPAAPAAAGGPIVCRSTATVIGGFLDLDGDGAAGDDGRFGGYPVIDGKVDVDGSGTADDQDNGVLGTLVITGGVLQSTGDVILPGAAMTTSGNADCILGGAGLDAVAGGDGGDHVLAGVGGDHVDGNGGDDVLRGEQGDDELLGGLGGDTLFGDSGKDLVTGDAGDDELVGGIDTDVLRGSDGGDRLSGGDDDDVLVGGSETPGATDDGGDLLEGGAGIDLLAGDNAERVREGAVLLGLRLLDVPFASTDAPPGGADRLDGGTGTDVLWGQAGSDTLAGGAAGDRLEGGPGDDRLFGDDGDDLVVGGSDQDRGGQGGVIRLLAGVLDGDDELHGGPGADDLLGDNGGRASNGVATTYDPDHTGSPAPSADVSGADRLFGEDGADRLYGHSGDDELHGGPEGDLLEGGADVDLVVGDAGVDLAMGGSSQRSGSGAAMRDGGDVLAGGGDGDVLAGDNATPAAGTLQLEDVPFLGTAVPADVAGNDEISGDDRPGDPASVPSGEDLVYAQSGDDLVYGNGADDHLQGGAGADEIRGQAGADDILGGSDRANVVDVDDELFGGDGDTDVGDAGDAVIGDNGTISRRGGLEPGTPDEARTIVVHDVAVVGGVVPSSSLSGPDRLVGGGGRDRLVGQGGDDLLEGGAGDDDVEGGAGGDDLLGQAVEDDLVGGSSSGPDGAVRGHDFGARGPTSLVDGADDIDGGDGHDGALGDNGRIDRAVATDGTWRRLRASYAEMPVRTLVVANRDEPAGAFGNDGLLGSDGHDELHGQLGNDRIDGGTGDDTLLGDLGSAVLTVLDGSAGRQITADGGFLRDTVDEAGSLRRRVTLFSSSFTANDQWGGGDTIDGGDGRDVLHGGAGSDVLDGSGVDRTAAQVEEMAAACAAATTLATRSPVCDEDVLFGGDGDDRTWGGPGHDHLYGGHGADDLDVVSPTSGDPDTDFKGVDLLFGGWGPDRLQADRSQPSPNGEDKLLDASGAYNAYFVCEGAYGGHSIVRKLSPDAEIYLQELSLADGAVDVRRSGSSGFRELSMIFKGDYNSNSSPKHPDHPGNFTCS